MATVEWIVKYSRLADCKKLPSNIVSEVLVTAFFFCSFSRLLSHNTQVGEILFLQAKEHQMARISGQNYGVTDNYIVVLGRKAPYIITILENKKQVWCVAERNEVARWE